MGGNLVALRGRLSNVSGLTHLPFLFIHGALNDPELSADVFKALRDADPAAPAELHVLPKRGHDIRLGQDDDLTLPFLARHVRDPFPRRVRLCSPSPARAFWIEVVEKGGGLAEVDAAITGSTIEITTRRVRTLRVLLRRELFDGDPLAPPEAGSRPDRGLRVVLNGKEAHHGPFEEDCGRLAASWRTTGDPHLAHTWERTFEIP
jgi:hypothetical protein